MLAGAGMLLATATLVGETHATAHNWLCEVLTIRVGIAAALLILAVVLVDCGMNQLRPAGIIIP